MMWWFDGWSGWWLVMPLVMVAFWIVVTGGIVALVRGTDGGSGTTGSAPAEPEQILGERFARGEIDAREYQRRLATLRNTQRGTAA